ncbi:hypothetical protein ACOSQ4_031122 [Xanthoceras sorbifolium]
MIITITLVREHENIYNQNHFAITTLETFFFSAQAPPGNSIKDSEKLPKVGVEPLAIRSNSKRARSENIAEDVRMPTLSFKSKLLGMTTPRNWEGFGVCKDKLQIGEGDIKFVEELEGKTLKLSADLKKKL